MVSRFYRCGFVLWCAVWLLWGCSLVGVMAEGGRSRVVVVERPSLVSGEFRVDAGAVRRAFIEGLQVYTGEKNLGVAWKKLGIEPEDTVGVRIHAAGNPVMSTRRALVDAIVESLGAAGVPPSRIIIWDKHAHELEGAGYLPQIEGELPRVQAVVPTTGFDAQVFYVNEVLGKLIWGDHLFRGRQPTKADLLKAAERVVRKHEDDQNASSVAEEAAKRDAQEQTSNRSYFAKLLTTVCSKIVNVPVAVDHRNFGIEGCLASLAMHSIDNSRRFDNERFNGDPAIADILDRDLFRKKVVLHVMDALIAQYAGGPDFVPLYTQQLGEIYLSRDPVAIDSQFLPRFEEWRAAKAIVPIGDRARHIAAAASYGLGKKESDQIDLIRLR